MQVPSSRLRVLQHTNAYHICKSEAALARTAPVVAAREVCRDYLLSTH
jgi:hypothetical protein